jgi:HupF/HypC family
VNDLDAPDPGCGPWHCVTCADDGDPMTVLTVDTRRGLALCCDEDGVHHTVEIALVDPVGAGELLLVHAGTAIALLPATTGMVVL